MNKVPPKEPYVFQIGPLDVENRYSVKFDSGLRQEVELTINTHISPDESNVVFLHCDRYVPTYLVTLSTTDSLTHALIFMYICV